MVFKRLLGALGVGAPTVDTALAPGPVVPGGTLSGEVRLKGGNADYEIEQITLELVARVEAEYEDGEAEGGVAFGRFTVGGGFRLGEEAEQSVPFSVTLPWETPVTELHGQSLGIVLGVRTELEVAGAKDKGDLDALSVAPLPAQEAVLEALGQLGFGFASADLELGHIHGTGQQLPFYQEVELRTAPQYAEVLRELEVTFLASPAGVEVVLEGDKRGSGMFGQFGGGDAVNRHVVAHEDVEHRDWTAEVDAWVRALVDARAAYAGHGGGGYGTHGHKDGYHGGHHGSGPGMGAAVAAGAAGLAAGVVGGMVAAEVVDEIGDAFEGEDEDEGGDEG
ncbi:sporulation protein [Streptomyces sp. WMMC897]|uniref:sporulation protein n=1 Tax=Streptomyces sp. WMMC897 TaxID=3014782 RepID=UPI0022B71D32|nr:sporulation protein [Streptomyces sp. WMMC897]MCZ7415284.1 sporulation protein [Streptomyces sp. WMMC897]